MEDAQKEFIELTIMELEQYLKSDGIQYWLLYNMFWDVNINQSKLVNIKYHLLTIERIVFNWTLISFINYKLVLF